MSILPAKILLILGLIFVLGACGDGGNGGPTDEPAPTDATENGVDDNNDSTTADFDFTIDIITQEDRDALERYVEIEYATDLGDIEGLTLLFDFNQPISDFALLKLGSTLDGEPVVMGILHEVGDLGFQGLNEHLVLTNYFSGGTLAASGFYFLDPDGNERWYVFQISQRDGNIYWHSFSWSSEYDFYVPGETGNDQSNTNPAPPNSGSGTATRVFGIERFNAAEVALLGDHSRFVWSGSEMDDLTDLNAVFTFSENVTNFQFLFVGWDENLNFANFGVSHDVGDVAAGRPVVLTHYNHVGTVSNSGFTFRDASGVTHWYVFQESQMDGSIAFWPFHWDLSYPVPIYWEEVYHEVVAGDTLFSIARYYDMYMGTIQQLNDMGDSTDIRVGQRLRIGRSRPVYE